MSIEMEDCHEPMSGVCECGAELGKEDQFDDGKCFECWLAQFREV